eukprot:3358698-Alexandrium_andersonii.AAC.1
MLVQKSTAIVSNSKARAEHGLQAWAARPQNDQRNVHLIVQRAYGARLLQAMLRRGHAGRLGAAVHARPQARDLRGE